ncbi:MAG: glycosyltransferase [Gemmatimonadota bacterium]|nr:glycosyltransferase [Gemmatimonadota bacterium]
MVIREKSASVLSPVTDSTSRPQVSVIVASIDAAASIASCVRSVQASVSGFDAEVIVADASSDDTASRVESEFPDVRVIRMPPGTLAPRLWTAGLAQAAGQRVAFMTGHSVVGTGWVNSLSEALGNGAGGAGGPLTLRPDSSITDAAIYFLRYSAFMPPADAAPYTTHEIAGDNSIYRGELLRSHMASFADGFWEVPFHSILRAQGETLTMVPAAAIDFGQSFSLGSISGQRFAHGRHFGKWRVRTGTSGKVRIVVGAPVVPLVLLTRIIRRALAATGVPLGRLLAASPLILWLGMCWAFGEAVGALEA